MRREQGIYPDVSALNYHAGAGIPNHSLSSSLASRLLRQSPAHAWAYCPTGGGFEDDSTAAQEVGTAVHEYVLCGPDRFVIVEEHDWRKKEAQRQRDEAIASGFVPVLSAKMERIRNMAAAIRKQCGAFEEAPRPLSEGKPEVTLIWCETTPHGDVWCRARPDWMRTDHAFIEDLKTTTIAEPDTWIRRQLFRMDYDLQCAFYQRGAKVLTGKDVGWRFVVAEVDEPHLTSIVGLSPAALDHAHDRAEQAIQTWARCLKSKDFPGYPKRTAYADVPAYELASWEAKMMDEEEDGK